MVTFRLAGIEFGSDHQEPGISGLGVGGRVGDASVPISRDVEDEADDQHVGSTLWACVRSLEMRLVFASLEYSWANGAAKGIDFGPLLLSSLSFSSITPLFHFCRHTKMHTAKCLFHAREWRRTCS